MFGSVAGLPLSSCRNRAGRQLVLGSLGDYVCLQQKSLHLLLEALSPSHSKSANTAKMRQPAAD
jgi:hypothetical protein